MTSPREMRSLFDIIAARVSEGRAYHFFQNAPAGEVRLRAAIISAFMFVTFCGTACTRDPSNRERLTGAGVPRNAIEPRSPAMQAEYTLRSEALAANPTSVAAQGALAVFLHANDYLSEAAARYEDLRRKDPKEARWGYLLARILQDQGQSERALALLDEAAALAPQYSLIEFRRAELLFKSGEQAKAERSYHAYLERVPMSPHARLALARIALHAQDWERTEKLLVETIELEPNFPSARSLLVSVYEARGQQAQAKQAREKAGLFTRTREPDDPWFDELVEHCFDVEKLSVLADAAIETGRLSHGIRLLERSRQIEPNRARTHFELARANLRLGDRASAIPLLSAAVRLEPSLAEAHYLLAGELQAAGDLTGALASCDVALRHSPRHAGLHRQHGVLLQAANRAVEARAALERAVTLDPSEIRNVEALGNFYWSAGEKDLAVRQFERARVLSRMAVKPRAILGGYYLEQSRLAEAERCITEAFEIEPGLAGLDELRAALYVQSGNALFRSGDASGAVTAYRNALAAKPDHEESVTNLVAVWLHTERVSEARELLSSFLAAHPEATFAYSLAARVAAQSGDRIEAVQLATRGLGRARAQRDERQEQALRMLLERLRAP